MKIKNKIFNISIIIIALFNTVNGQGTSPDKLTPEALKLVYKYAIESSDSTQFGKLFFYVFPNQFEEFNKNYGYIDDVGKMPLYDVYNLHLNLLFRQVTKIPDSIFYDKVIRIGIGAKWDVDAINFFQDQVYDLILRNPTVTVTILNNYNENQIQNFCTFIIDGVDLSDLGLRSKYNLLYNDLNKVDFHIAKILKDAYEKRLKKQ